MAWFSQRKCYKKAKDTIQLDRMDDELRNAIWNALFTELFNRTGFMESRNMYDSAALVYAFADDWWSTMLKLPLDSRPQHADKIYDSIRKAFFSGAWFEVYDFLEFTVARFPELKLLHEAINRALEHELAGYRLIGGRIVELTTESELTEVDVALEQTEFPAASEHLRRALELISDKRNPDPRNSIKESISAIESASKVIASTPKATLDDAIRALEKSGKLHPCLKAGFSKLYGYTSDEGGIRHAMIDEPNLTKADALFFLVSCSAFINYLKSKL